MSKLIEKSFNGIISVLKKRKTVLMSEIIDYFGEEKEKVNADEKKWIENQKIAEKIVSLAKDSDDGKIGFNIYTYEYMNVDLKYVFNEIIKLIQNSQEVYKPEFMKYKDDCVVFLKKCIESLK